MSQGSGLEHLTEVKKVSCMLKDIIGVGKLGWPSSHLTNSAFKWKVNNGASTLFWEDEWFEDKDLKESFSRLYSLLKWRD